MKATSEVITPENLAKTDILANLPQIVSDKVSMALLATVSTEGRSRWLPRTLTPAASANLDFIRAIAASAVMWGHLRTLFFDDFQHLENPGPVLKILYFATGFGHQSVMVFFVLSGFLISASIIKALATGRWSTKEYAIHRAARLYVVLIPGLLLGLFLDLLGSRIFASSGLYSRPIEGLGSAVAVARLTARNFIGNLFFLQTIACPTFGSNSPLWSLANEFWYYVLFPLGLFAAFAWRKKNVGHAALLTAAFALCAYSVGPEILAGFPVWLMGVAVVLAYGRAAMPGMPLRMLIALFGALALGACLTAARLGSSSLAATDWAVGLAFALFLFGVIEVSSFPAHETFVSAARSLAGFSYSLYVLHFPILLFLRALITPGTRWEPDSLHLLLGALIGAGVLLSSWGISLVTENRTGAARNWLRSLLARRLDPHHHGNSA